MRRIEVVDHDAGWRLRFESESAELRGVFADTLVAVHHVGSTSVPGLKAKPTIDILVELAEDCHVPSFDPAMQNLGYVCRGECLDATVRGTPGRFYYVRKDGVVHLTHVHVCKAGHVDVEKMLCFRDHLRSNPESLQAYAHLKSELAVKFSHDNIGYMQGKDACVKKLTADAIRAFKAGKEDSL